MKHRLRIGLIGCGGFSTHFVPYLLKEMDVVALCDPDQQNTSRLAAEYELEAQCYSDHRRMVDDGGLDAVAITAPNFAHCELTCAAAEAGLHVYCEKAMARTVPECWQMVRACQSNHVKLMVGHKRRLRPPWARMIELTDQAALGRPLTITVCEYCDEREFEFYQSWWGDPSLSGGFFHMHGVHVIDWLRAMCGDAVRVMAIHGPQHDSRYKFPDIWHATFEFESGALASINGSLAYPLHRFRESQGPWGECTQGAFKMVPYLDHIDLYWHKIDESAPHHERFDDLGHAHAFAQEVGDFARWITEDEFPCLTWIEGLRCVELMEAAYCSAEASGDPVSLPLYPELETAPAVP